MITHEEFEDALKIVNEYHAQVRTHFNNVSKEIDRVCEFASINKDTSINDCNCSQRLRNVLLCYGDGIDGDTKISEVSDKIIANEFLKVRGAGSRTLSELEKLFYFAGVRKYKPLTPIREFVKNNPQLSTRIKNVLLGTCDINFRNREPLWFDYAEHITWQEFRQFRNIGIKSWNELEPLLPSKLHQ